MKLYFEKYIILFVTRMQEIIYSVLNSQKYKYIGMNVWNIPTLQYETQNWYCIYIKVKSHICDQFKISKLERY